MPPATLCATIILASYHIIPQNLEIDHYEEMKKECRSSKDKHAKGLLLIKEVIAKIKKHIVCPMQ